MLVAHLLDLNILHADADAGLAKVAGPPGLVFQLEPALDLLARGYPLTRQRCGAQMWRAKDIGILQQPLFREHSRV